MKTIEYIIPARKVVLNLLWLKRDFATMSPKYKELRRQVGGGMCACHICERPFVHGESFALGCAENIGNKTFCHACIDRYTTAKE